MKKHIFTALLIVAAILCTACSGSSGVAYDNFAGGDSFKSEADYSYSFDSANGMMSAEAMPSAPAEAGKAVDQNADPLAGRKIIRTVRLSAETKAFDVATAAIESLCAEVGGYIESSSRSGGSIRNASSVVARYASYTLRIPAEKLDAFCASVGESIHIVDESSGIDDITDQYFDVDARLETLRVEEERLLAMLEKATELEYLITLEQRLSEVRYEIERYTGTLRRYDSQVAYSTVHLNLSEVIEYTEVIETPTSFGEELSVAFRESWTAFAEGCRAFAVWFVYAIPTLLVLAVIATVLSLVLVALFRRTRRPK